MGCFTPLCPEPRSGDGAAAPGPLQTYQSPAQTCRDGSMIERQIDIPTPDGATTTFIVHPERGGPHPPILFFMDAPAIREELRDMARRLASAGYYVMLPNLYYRAGVMELGPLTDEAARERMFGF